MYAAEYLESQMDKALINELKLLDQQIGNYRAAKLCLAEKCKEWEAWLKNTYVIVVNMTLSMF